MVRFPVGSKAYDKEGRFYTVEEVAGGVVYCLSANGAETEFPEASLQNEAEWTARADGRRDLSYARIRQSKTFSAAKVTDRAAAGNLLSQADRMIPGLVDYAAYTAAARVLTENKDFDAAEKLSIVKCRKLFDETPAEVRATILAGVLGVAPEKLIDAAKLGDNMAKAMMEKGLEPQADSFEDFCDRPRR